MWLSTDRARRPMRSTGWRSRRPPDARTLDQHLAADSPNTYVHSVTSAEFKRWLERQGATFEPAKGGHIWVMLRGRRAILPMHGSRKEMKGGTVAAIKKQLGLE
jgi:mRNA interferase HicA